MVRRINLLQYRNRESGSFASPCNKTIHVKAITIAFAMKNSKEATTVLTSICGMSSSLVILVVVQMSVLQIFPIIPGTSYSLDIHRWHGGCSFTLTSHKCFLSMQFLYSL
jgi:ribonuclease I